MSTDSLPRPSGTRVVLVGASEFAHLGRLPSVASNIEALANVFRREWSLPDGNCKELLNPTHPVDISSEVRKEAAAATDTLLIYYAGHGLIDSAGRFHLAVGYSDPSSVHDTSTPYEWIRREVEKSRASRRIVILDCCFSARAFGTQSGRVADLADVDGTYILAAAAETAVALAPPGDEYTAFTAALLEVLRSGINGAPELLNLEATYTHIRLLLRKRQLPAPQSLGRNEVGHRAFVRNAAFSLAKPNSASLPESIHTGFFATIKPRVRSVYYRLIRRQLTPRNARWRMRPRLMAALFLTWLSASGDGHLGLNATPPELDFVDAITFTSDGRLLTNTSSGLHLWSVSAGGRKVKETKKNGACSLGCEAFSHDGKLAAVSLFDAIKIYDTQTGASLIDFNTPKSEISSIALSPDSKTVAVGYYSGEVQFLDAKTGKLKETAPRKHAGAVKLTAFSPDGKYFASAARESKNQILVFTMSERLAKASHTLSFKNDVSALSFSSTGKSLAIGDMDGRILLWETGTTNPYRELKGSAFSEYPHSVAAGSTVLAVGYSEQRAALWDMKTGNKIRDLPTPAESFDYATTVELSPDESMTATVNREGIVDLWDSRTGEKLNELLHEKDVEQEDW